MTIRALLVAALVAVTVAASAAAAPSPIGHLYSPCGRVTVAGHAWVYGAHEISCAAAKRVVRRLGGSSHPSGPAGVFAGMACFWAQKGVQVTINCLGPHGLMLAVRPR